MEKLKIPVEERNKILAVEITNNLGLENKGKDPKIIGVKEGARVEINGRGWFTQGDFNALRLKKESGFNYYFINELSSDLFYWNGKTCKTTIIPGLRFSTTTKSLKSPNIDEIKYQRVFRFKEEKNI